MNFTTDDTSLLDDDVVDDVIDDVVDDVTEDHLGVEMQEMVLILSE
jgi:hypothetical protein